MAEHRVDWIFAKGTFFFAYGRKKVAILTLVQLLYLVLAICQIISSLMLHGKEGIKSKFVLSHVHVKYIDVYYKYRQD